MLLKVVCLVTVLSYALAYDKMRTCETFGDYANFISGNCSYSTDAKDMPELVSQYGYQIDTHNITTKDGYILTVFNLKHPNPKGVILFGHYFLGSSAAWVDKGNTSLGYALYNEGYDIWMINFRGNFYSKKYTHLINSDIEYWDFSWHEMAIYDLPACIAYVKAATSAPKIMYIGYSMGGSTIAAYCSLNPDACVRDLKGIALLAPGVSFEVNRAIVLQIIAYTFPLLQVILTFLHIGQFLPRTAFTVAVMGICRVYPGVQLCMTILRELAAGPGQSNPPMNPIAFFEFPAGASVKTLVHFGQCFSSRRYAQYDYGPDLNKKYYNSTINPLYPVENIRTPIYVISGTEDYLVPPENTLNFYNRLDPAAKAAKDVHLILGYNHVDYVWSATRNILINLPIIAIIKYFNSL